MPAIEEYAPMAVPGEPRPTLSVILPTWRNRWRLGTQLEAVLSQITDRDELIVLVQEADEVDELMRQRFAGPRVRWIFAPQPLGVCGAYNYAASVATKDWIAQLSGNDEWQPGAYDVWLDAARKWPEARIMHGHVRAMTMLPWLPETGWVSSTWLAGIWNHQGWKLHGSGTLIRRDSWGEGYPRTLGYMADQFLAMKLTMLHGCVYLRHYMSYVNWLPGGASQAHGIQVARNNEKAEFLRLLKEPENKEFYEQFLKFDAITHWSKED
jgi:glycosyltransferase involved in cell wall biosynthesis